MRRLILIAALTAAAGAARAAELPDPIAPASDGKLQCYAPDLVHKTCGSIGAYRLSLEGGIENPATVLISAKPVVTMQTTSPVTIKDGQVCGFIRTEDIDEATFSIDGAAASPEQTAKLRAQIIAVFEKGIFGHEICTAYVPDGDGFIAKATIDGVAQPKMDQRVIWVAPKDGYRVGR